MEAMLVVALIGMVLAIGVPRFAQLERAVAVDGAAAALVRALADARHTAWQRGTRVAVRIDSAAGRVDVSIGADTVAALDLRASYGVSLAASRDSLAYAPSGLGYGAANATFVVHKRGDADTVWVSRTGRVRR